MDLFDEELFEYGKRVGQNEVANGKVARWKIKESVLKHEAGQYLVYRNHKWPYGTLFNMPAGGWNRPYKFDSISEAMLKINEWEEEEKKEYERRQTLKETYIF